MAIEKTPVSPVAQNYVPPGGRPYKVTDKDDWFSVARTAGIDALDLIEFNFKTRTPAEVNWYLRRNVGCKKQTTDGKNYMFHASAHPGIVYLPPLKGPAPHPRLNIWFGVAVKGGGHLGIAGKETIQGWVVSYDNYDDSFFLNVDSWRLGLGLGGAMGMVLVIVTGVSHPSELQGHMTGGGDFQASLGAKWSALAKSTARLPFLIRASKQYKFLPKIGKGAITVAEWEKSRDAIRSLISAAGINPKDPNPNITFMDLPGIGAGLELSLYRQLGKVSVHGISMGSQKSP